MPLLGLLCPSLPSIHARTLPRAVDLPNASVASSMDKTKFITYITLLSTMALTACSGSEFTSQASVDGAAGQSGTSGTSGSAGYPDQDSGSGAGGMTGDSGVDGQAGNSGTGGTSGSGAGGGVGTGGSAGDSGTGGTAGTDGGSGTGGTAGIGGSSGDACVPQPCANDGVTCGEMPDGCGGMSKCLHTCTAPDTCNSNHKCNCVEFSYTELVQACKGNCGSFHFKCNAGSHSCAQIDSSNACSKYQWCDVQSDQSGICRGCTADPSYSASCGGLSPWLCQPGFFDQIQDYGETDVDCGGPTNPNKCLVGKSCSKNSDCQLQACMNNKCANSSKAKIGCNYASTFVTGDLFCCP